MPADLWNPNQYDLFARERSIPFSDLLSLLAPLDRPRVADLGCGTGELTAQAHQTLLARQTQGFDTSEAMLNRASTAKISSLSFSKGSVAELIQEGPWDLIIAHASLQWIPDHATVISQLISSLVPGGQLAIQVPANATHPSHTLITQIAESAAFRERFPTRAPTDPVASNVLAPSTYAGLLWESGVAHQRVRLEVYPHLLSNTRSIVEWTRGTTLTRIQAVLPPQVFETFVSLYEDRLVEVLGDHSPYLYTFDRILLWAQTSPGT
ncbi:MAG: methyltransferase domain-containing protein [Ferrimicrobium sp.]